MSREIKHLYYVILVIAFWLIYSYDKVKLKTNMQPENQPSITPNSNSSNPQPPSLSSGQKVIQPTPELIQELQAQQQSAPPVQPTSIPQPVASSVYPEPTSFQNTTTTAPTDTNVGLTGSQIKQEKKPMSIGVYIIAGLNLLGFVIGFFDTSQNSGIYTIAMLLDLLLAIGLLLRLEVARKFIMWLSGLILVLTAVSLIMLVGLQQRISQLKTNYETAISRIDQSRLTPTQKQQLDAVQAAIAVKEKQAGKAIAFTYVKLGVTGVEMLGVMIYLSRPKVKEVFHELET
jgi:hypothetical protein